LEAQRNQRGLRRHHVETELRGDLVGERGRADLRYGEPARRDDERRGVDAIARRLDAKRLVAALDVANLARLPPFDLSDRALGAQHLDDLQSAAVAEELAE